MRRIYVETLIKADVDKIWTLSQDPAEHTRWDARFSRIDYLEGTEPRRFRYATFGIAGIGITTGERLRADDSRTSALRFASSNPLSPIRSGAGYWRYVPTSTGVRFLTGYDYHPGWGKVPDLLVRPVMSWLTAWSFDRLRLWIDKDVRPEDGLRRAIAECAARGGLVVAAASLGVVAAATTALLMLLLPPLPKTPAARRCQRRAPDRRSATAPSTLDLLEAP